MAHQDWEKFMTDGDKYLRSAQGGQERPQVFTPAILYNIIGMAIEKHVMAALLFHDRMANNHTFVDLIEAAAELRPLDDELSTKLRELEGFQDLCTLQGGSAAQTFTREMVPGMLDVAEGVQSWARKCVGMVEEARP